MVADGDKFPVWCVHSRSLLFVTNLQSTTPRLCTMNARHAQSGRLAVCARFAVISLAHRGSCFGDGDWHAGRAGYYESAAPCRTAKLRGLNSGGTRFRRPIGKTLVGDPCPGNFRFTCGL